MNSHVGELPAISSDISFAVAALNAVANATEMRNNFACYYTAIPAEQRLLGNAVTNTFTRDLAKARGFWCKVGVTLWMIGINALLAAGVITAAGGLAVGATVAEVATFLGVNANFITDLLLALATTIVTLERAAYDYYVEEIWSVK